MFQRILSALALCGGVLLSVCVSPISLASNPDPALVDRLAHSAPNLNRKILRTALQATECAVANGVSRPERLAIIDYSLPSSEQRLWVLDLEHGNLILREWVAHGKQSGDNRATRFSNRLNSHQSSLGLFRTSESYRGKHGYSLRLDGLEPGINDLARERAIVIHGADYVDPSWIEAYGRLGRSFGCPAVRQQAIREVVDSLKGGQLLFTYYPDQNWLESSDYLNCSGASEEPGNLLTVTSTTR